MNNNNNTVSNKKEEIEQVVKCIDVNILTSVQYIDLKAIF